MRKFIYSMKIYLWLILLLIISWNPDNFEKKDNCKVINIDAQNAKNYPLRNLVAEYNLIKLECTEAFILSDISKVLILNERIYIYDFKLKTIFVFNIDGKGIMKIHKQGHGPGEYINLSDFFIDIPKNNFEILDGTQKKLIIYNEKGDFLTEEKMDFSATHFINNPKGRFFSNQLSREKKWQYKLIFTDKKLRIKSTYLNYKENMVFVDINMMSRSPFQMLNDEITYLPSYSNKIYRIFEDRIEEKYLLDFGKNWITDDFYKEKPTRLNDFFRRLENEKVVYFLNYCENSTHLILDYYIDGKSFMSFFDKRTQTLITSDNIKENFLGLKNEPHSVYNDYFVFSVEPLDILSNTSYLKFDENEQISKFLKNLKENDNPIIVLTKFKKIN